MVAVPESEDDTVTAWRHHATKTKYLERTPDQVFLATVTSKQDAGGDRDTRPPKPCCDRVGTGAWCGLDKGHAGDHVSMASEDFNPVRDPEYKFLPANPPKITLRLHGGWRDELTLKKPENE